MKEVRPEYGRFRSFLFASVRHFLSNERDRERAQKRGGGRRLVSLDADEAERAYERTPVDATTPETVFERSWARSVFDRVLERLEHEAAPGDARKRVLRLRPFLTGAEPSSSFADIAREWGVGESAVRVALHRLRRRFAGLLREEVAGTVADERDVDDEVRHVLSLLE